MNREKGLAYCGLACCVCSENETCLGSRNDGCKDKGWCKPLNCCKRNKLNGCWECPDFSCDTPSNEQDLKRLLLTGSLI